MLKTGRRTNVGNKVRGKRPNTTAGVRVNNYQPSPTRRRRVPKGIRRGPVGRVPTGYASVEKMSMSVHHSTPVKIFPTILPREPVRSPFLKSHSIPVQEDWSKLFAPSKVTVRTREDLREKQRQARLPKNIEGTVDVDGDGIVDEVEINLAKILRNVAGVDLDGDGVVTEEETRACRVAKGKHIYAESFIRDFPGIRNFWTPYRYFNDDQIVVAITGNQDFAVNMNNMLHAGRQHKCAASTRMHQALTDTTCTGGVNHMLFDHRERTNRLKMRKQALFKQALSRHSAKLLPETFGIRRKFASPSGHEGKSFRAYAQIVQRAKGIMGCHRVKG